MEVVNGYVCKSCCDVALAKKGVDPAHPKDDPANPAYDPKIAAAHKTQAGGMVRPAVTFGGQLAALNGAASVIDHTRAASPYSPGSIVNLSA